MVESIEAKMKRLRDAPREMYETDRGEFAKFVKYLSETFFNGPDLNLWRKISARMFEGDRIPDGAEGVWEKWVAAHADPESLSKDLQKNLGTTGRERYQLMVALVFAVVDDQVARLAQIVGEDALYFGILNNLGIDSSTAQQSVGKLEGTYQFWRYANRVKGCCIKGMYQISRTESGAARVRAVQCYDPTAFENDPGHLAGRWYEYGGYAVKGEGRRVFMIFTDGQSGIVVSNYFNEVDYVPKHARSRPSLGNKAANPARAGAFTAGSVFQMSGTSMGVDGNITFSSPIYVERVSQHVYPDGHEASASLFETLNLYPMEKTPTRVRGTLRFLAEHNNRGE